MSVEEGGGVFRVGALARAFCYEVTAASESGVVSWDETGVMLDLEAEAAEVSEEDREVGAFGSAVVPPPERLMAMALEIWEAAQISEARFSADCRSAMSRSEADYFVPVPMGIVVLGVSPVFALTEHDCREASGGRDVVGNVAIFWEGYSSVLPGDGE